MHFKKSENVITGFAALALMSNEYDYISLFETARRIMKGDIVPPQDEAIEVADEIVITNEGRVEQVGDPVDIYLHPKTSFTAKFIGKSSVITDYGKLKGFNDEGEGTEAVIRPEFVELLTNDSPKGNDPSYEDAMVEQSIFRGDSFEVILDIDGLKIKANSPLVNGPLKSGDRVKAFINMIYIIRGEETYQVKNSSLDDSNTYFI